MADGKESVSMAITSDSDVPGNRVPGRQALGGIARTRRTAAQLLQAVPMLPVLILTSVVFCITVDGFT